MPTALSRMSASSTLSPAADFTLTFTPLPDVSTDVTSLEVMIVTPFLRNCFSSSLLMSSSSTGTMRGMNSTTVTFVPMLYTDGAAADDDHGCRLLGQHHGLSVADDLFAIHGQGGQLSAPPPGGDDDVLGLDHLGFPVASAYFDLALRDQFPESHHHVDLIFLHQELYALTHFICYPAAALDHRVKLRGAAGLDSIILRMLDIFIDLCTLEQGLGGDTTPVQANAAQTFFLNDCGFEP